MSTEEPGPLNDIPATPTDSDGDVRASHVIGIGASAGGLEALQTLFAGLECDTGAAYVVVQHLSPDFATMMDQLLAKHTAMLVKIIEDGEYAAANAVYLIPPRKTLIISDGHLLLSDPPNNSGFKLPIDTFFRSLAEDQQHRAIGVILSGTGSDGTRGIKALKEAGGMIIVQDPSDAKFDGMPSNALNTGYADVVLPATEIPAQLASYVTHPLINPRNRNSFKRHLAEHEDVLQNILLLLRKRNEIDFTEYKPSTLARRIERRIGINNLGNITEYNNYLQQHPSEVQVLTKEMLIGVTRFFRDDEAFERLTNEVLLPLVESKTPNEPIRIWCAGISTGEEAYSLAILLTELQERLKVKRNVKIFATDVDEEAIAVASAGIFSQSIADDISQVRLQHYFEQIGTEYSVRPRLRKMVVFAVHNLIKDPPFSNMDLVTCRNMLIYLQHSAQKKALAMLHFSLRMEGYMLLGMSESLGYFSSHFHVVDSRNKLFRKISNMRIPLDTATPNRVDRRMPTLPSVNQMMARHRSIELQHTLTSVNQVLLKNYVPPAIILNESLNALHTYGDVSDYIKKLQPGRVSTNIVDLIEDSMSIAVTTAIQRAVTKKQDVIYRAVLLKTEIVERLVNVRVQYIPPDGSGHSWLVLLFEQNEQPVTESVMEYEFHASDHAQQRILDLEQELQQSRESLSATVEELETTNEELQSTNEELMSANEELQSTNEELQSVNEELYTVNSEHQLKIQELSKANDDLDNFIKSSSLAIIFLDRDLLIRRYTPAITRYINVLPLDLERPFQHISHSLRIDNLLEQLNQVLSDHQALELKAETNGLGSVRLRILPYITKDQEIGGVTLTIIELTSDQP